MKWTQVDFEAGLVSIEQSLAEPKSGLVFKSPKNGRSRTISVGAGLLAILRAHHATQAEEKLRLGPPYNDQGLVFALPTGEPVKPWNFGSAFVDLVKRSEVTPITLHDLRRTHASLFREAGAGIEVVSNRLGHSGIGITVDTYMSVYPESDAAATAAFERLVS